MGRPAARPTDMTVHGSPLAPGPGSFNVLIGGLPAWRGITAAQAAVLAQAVAEAARKIAEASAAATAAAGTPAGPAAALNLANTAAEQVGMLGTLMTSMADTHACPIVKVVVPDGMGVVIDGSQTVLINNLAACRMGDTIQEATSINKIALGLPTVLIGP